MQIYLHKDTGLKICVNIASNGENSLVTLAGQPAVRAKTVDGIAEPDTREGYPEIIDVRTDDGDIETLWRVD